MIITNTLYEALRDLLATTLSRGEKLGLDDGGPVLDKARAALAEYNRIVAESVAHEDTIEAARKNYANDDINIDDDARVSVGDAGVWVEAWVYVPIEE